MCRLSHLWCPTPRLLSLNRSILTPPLCLCLVNAALSSAVSQAARQAGAPGTGSHPNRGSGILSVSTRTHSELFSIEQKELCMFWAQMQPRGRSKGQTNNLLHGVWPAWESLPSGTLLLPSERLRHVRQQQRPQKRVNRACQGPRGPPKDRRADRGKVREACWLLSRCGRVAGNSGSIEGTGRKKQPRK